MIEKKIILVGNPNVGKSVIFNCLTGKYVTVSNYPGTTVDITKGSGFFKGEEYLIIDTPGINSLTPNSEDEQVTKNIISTEKPNLIIQVADEKNLKRSLLLTLELLELEIPLVLDLNINDEARDRGIKIDIKKLEGLLGMGIVETVGITKEGLGELKKRIIEAKKPALKFDLRSVKNELKKFTPLEIHTKRMTVASGDLFLTGFKHREKIVDEIIEQVITYSGKIPETLSAKIGRFTTHPFFGYIIAVAILYLMYLFVGKFAAGECVDFFEEKIFGRFINPFAGKIIESVIPVKFLAELFIGDYGIITMALTYALAIIFPIVTAFFLFFAILEDSGYLPRLSVMLDKFFRIIGLNGKAVLPMVLGLGCGTMATLTTRILDTKKERIILTLLLALGVPCSAQLGVILGMLAGLSVKITIIWIFTMLFSLLFIGFLASKILSGARSEFLLELPPIRIPQITNILKKLKARIIWYIKEAVPLFVLGTLLLFIFDKLGILKFLENIFSPVVVNFLGLPVKATESFIIGFLRRDYGAAGLFVLTKEGLLNPQQVLVSIVVITLFVPCIAQFFVTIRERGIKVALFIFLFVFAYAVIFGGILNFVLNIIRIL